mgnify:CR=1 FL=1
MLEEVPLCSFGYWCGSETILCVPFNAAYLERDISIVWDRSYMRDDKLDWLVAYANKEIRMELVAPH